MDPLRALAAKLRIAEDDLRRCARELARRVKAAARGGS